MRRGDSVRQLDGDTFTIIIPGADERSAARIADRLRHALARATFANSGAPGGLTARFGVAAGDANHTGELLVRRARRVLEASIAEDKAQVIATSDFDDVIYLPAPAHVPALLQSASAA